MLYRLAFLTGLLIAAWPAAAAEPRPIGSAKQIRAGQGAVRLSVQSQTQQQGTLHVWFLREGGDSGVSEDVLKFERKQGVPIAGSNMIDSRPLVFSVPPGRYRLVAHGVKCPAMPGPGTAGCSVRENFAHYETSAAYYDGEVPIFEVAPGRLTDAGEFILEAPAPSPMTEDNAMDFAARNPRLFKIRVRPIAQPAGDGFRTLAAGPAPIVPDYYTSQISCPKRPKGASLYLPFTC